MATVLTVKEKSLEVIVVEDCPYDTSTIPIKAYLIAEPLDADNDGSNVIEVGSIASGEAPNVNIEIPCFFETANTMSGVVYSMEIVADPDGENPVVLASNKDLYIRIEEVVSL